MSSHNVSPSQLEIGKGCALSVMPIYGYNENQNHVTFSEVKWN
jgi:hypothetical protein